MYTLKWFIIIERAKHSDSALKLCFFSIIRNTHKPKVSSKFKNFFLGKAHSETCNAVGRLSLACSCLVIGANVSGTCCLLDLERSQAFRDKLPNEQLEQENLSKKKTDVSYYSN